MSEIAENFSYLTTAGFNNMRAGWITVTTVLMIMVTVTCLSDQVMAQETGCELERNARTRALDEMSWKQLNRINEQIFAEDYDEARVALDRLLERAGRDDYLQAIIYQVMGQIDWATDQYDSSLTYFEKAVELDVLPDSAQFSLMYQLAQLYFMRERYIESLDRLEIWFCKAPPGEIDSSAWVLEASIYSRMGDYRHALLAIENAIDLADEPREQWYQLKVAAHFELEQYLHAAKTLEEMIVLWPQKKQYWVQLSQISFKLKQSEKALAVMALAYRNRLLDSQADITWLSNLYSHAGIPYKAALVMEEGILNGIVTPTPGRWLMVADSWYRAEELERALEAYEQAGDQSSDGVVDLRRSYILVDLERWTDALVALNSALEKEGLGQSKEAEAYLLRGLAHFNLKQYEDAGTDWARASRNEDSREAAQQWLNHLREERRKQAS